MHKKSIFQTGSSLVAVPLNISKVVCARLRLVLICLWCSRQFALHFCVYLCYEYLQHMFCQTDADAFLMCRFFRLLCIVLFLIQYDTDTFKGQYRQYRY